MSLTTPQREWIQSLTGKAVLQQESQRLAQEREAAMSRVAAAVDQLHDRMRKDMSLTAVDGKGQTQDVLRYENPDQIKEFDHDDWQDGYVIADKDGAMRMNDMAGLVNNLAHQLETKTRRIKRDAEGQPVRKKDDNGVELDDAFEEEEVPLVDAKDLGDALYMPLVRQGLLPETFVPDDFSKTKQLVEASFNEYRERLKDKHEASAIKRFWNENKSLGFTVVGSMATIASTGINIKGLNEFNMADAMASARDPLSAGKDLAAGKADAVASMVGAGWDFVTDKGLPAYEDGSSALAAAKDTVKAGVQKLVGGGKANPDRLRRIEAMGPLVGGAVAVQVTEGFKPWGLGVTASSSFVAEFNAARFTKAMLTEPLTGGDVASAAEALCTALDRTLSACLPASAPDAATARQDAVTALRKGLLAALGDGKVIVAALEPTNPDPDAGQVVQAFAAAGKAGVDAAVAAGSLKALMDREADAVRNALSKKLCEDFTKTLEDEADADRQAVEALKHEKDAQKKKTLLEKRIAQMERDAKLLDWSVKLLGLGIDVASKFIAPMAIAGSAIKLMVNIQAAARRTIDMVAMRNSREDMLRAVSPFSAPVRNFLYNQEIQAAHYTAKAALELVNLIGAIVETAGLASGMGAAAAVVAGKSLQAAAAAGQAIEAVLYEAKKRMDLERAWSTYREALLRPESRKKGLIAIKENPTLAKYALAWGAVILKDPLVGDVMDRCGLTAEQIDGESATKNVVKYLELRFKDDNVVEGRLPVGDDWMPAPGAVLLTGLSWNGVLRRASEKADLIAGDTRAIDLGFLGLEESRAALQQALKPPSAAVVDPARIRAAATACLERVNQLHAALSAYKPKRKSGSGPIDHAQMRQVAANYLAELGGVRSEVSALLA